jgi:hypothetical protein
MVTALDGSRCNSGEQEMSYLCVSFLHPQAWEVVALSFNFNDLEVFFLPSLSADSEASSEASVSQNVQIDPGPPVVAGDVMVSAPVAVGNRVFTEAQDIAHNAEAAKEQCVSQYTGPSDVSNVVECMPSLSSATFPSAMSQRL